jgi:hypothetical protein
MPGRPIFEGVPPSACGRDRPAGHDDVGVRGPPELAGSTPTISHLAVERHRPADRRRVGGKRRRHSASLSRTTRWRPTVSSSAQAASERRLTPMTSRNCDVAQRPHALGFAFTSQVEAPDGD